MKTYNLSQEQAEDMAKNKPGTVTWMGMLPEQPPENSELKRAFNRAVMFQAPDNVEIGMSGGIHSINIPHPSGSIVGMKETWAYGYDWGICPKSRIHPTAYHLFYWRSSATMPPKAIRWKYKVTSTRVCRVGDVTYGEIKAMGHEIYSGSITNFSSFKPWFKTRFSKPRQRRVNGVITHYVSWHYDESTLPKSCCEPCCYKSDSVYHYKHLPHYPHINPFIEISKGERQ